MRSAVAVLAWCLGTMALAAEPTLPTPQGFVTDTVGVIAAPVRTRIENVVTELQQKTGAEIAVLTVASTAPLDAFSYAMRVAETWKPGRKGEDTGVVVLLVTGDRKLRVVTGYGVEGALPDGLVGEIQDREMVPYFKTGRFDEGLYRGVVAMAGYIAASRGVSLTGVPAPRPRRRAPQLPWWVVLLIVLVILVVIANSDGPTRRARGGHFDGPIYFPGPGPSRFPGGWGDGGGGFGGFGGGGFGGGGAGRDW